MPGIFGDETITPDQSPFGEDGQEDTEAVDTEGEEDADLEDDGSYEEEQDQSEEKEDDGAPEDGQAQTDPVAALGFKSAEEMANSYRELRKSYTQSRQQLAGTQAPQGQQQPPAQSGQGAQDMNAAFWNEFQQDPLGTMRYLIQQATGQAITQHVNPLVERQQNEQLSRNIESVAKDYRQINTPDGMQSLMERVAEIAEGFGNPGLAANPPKRILDMAARELYGDSKAKVYQQAKQKGRQEAEAARSKKAGLSAPTGSKKAPTVTPEQQIINEIFGAGGGGIFG